MGNWNNSLPRSASRTPIGHADACIRASARRRSRPNCHANRTPSRGSRPSHWQKNKNKNIEQGRLINDIRVGGHFFGLRRYQATSFSDPRNKKSSRAIIGRWRNQCLSKCLHGPSFCLLAWFWLAMIKRWDEHWFFCTGICHL